MAKVDYGQSVNFIVSLQAECGPTMYSSSILRLFYRLTSGHSLDLSEEREEWVWWKRHSTSYGMNQQ